MEGAPLLRRKPSMKSFLVKPKRENSGFGKRFIQ